MSTRSAVAVDCVGLRAVLLVVTTASWGLGGVHVIAAARTRRLYLRGVVGLAVHCMQYV